MESAIIALCVCIAFVAGFFARKYTQDTLQGPRAGLSAKEGVNTSEKENALESPPREPSREELIRRFQLSNFFNYSGEEMPSPEDLADRIIYGANRKG